MMKTTMMLAAALLATASFGQATQPLVQSTNGVEYASLASARAKITQVIDNPADMTAVMKSLSAADQKSFLAEVNAAILAAKILAVSDDELLGRLEEYSERMRMEVEAKDVRLQACGYEAY